MKLKQRKISWAPDSVKCTFEGCNEEEDLNHILRCPANPKLANEQPILDILNRVEPEYCWSNREMWYSHPPRQVHIPHSGAREKAYQEGKTIGNKGAIPPDIIQMIKKNCGKKANETIAELQQAILTRAKAIWGFRCKVFFEKKAIEKILRREEEEEQKRQEEERKRREEEQERIAERHRLIEERQRRREFDFTNTYK